MIYNGNSRPLIVNPPQLTQAGVLFTFDGPSAYKVYLAGDFNGWAKNSGGKVTDPAFEMQKDINGIWRKTVHIDSETFRYKFVVADEKGKCAWQPDPAVFEMDSDGNSVYNLTADESPPENTEPASAQFLSVYFNPKSGVTNCLVLDKGARVVQSIQLPAVSLDGFAQSEYKASAQSVYQNKFLELEFEILSPRSVSLTWSCLDKNVRNFDVRIADNSDYYGCGERFNALNQKGYILPMASIDHPENKGTASYKPVPFFMSTRGYGIWVNSYSPGSFDLNATERDNCIIRYRENQLKIVFFAGPEMNEIIKEFTALSGRPPLPPAWAFAPWKSRDVHNNRDEVLQDAEYNRKYDLPASVIVIDSPWETGYNNFILNREQFADPEGMFSRLEELGYYVCLWMTPFVNSQNLLDMRGIEKGASSNFDEASRQNYLVKVKDGGPAIIKWWKGKGGLVDFTDPHAVGWWYGQLDRTKEWKIVHAFKCDDGEGNFLADTEFADGTSAEKMKNRYAELYLKTMYEYIQKNLSGDGVLFARAGFSGTQKYPFCWAGDNFADFSFSNGLPSVIIAGQTAALSGMSLWGHDIAGYQGRPTKELFIRWSQFGAFSPLMQIHMTSNLGAWDFDRETLDIYRKFAKIHMGLFPYIYETARESNLTGMPLIRPMVLACPGDTEAAKYLYQYFFGPELLVAPMYQPGTHRTVYLPEGVWIDYWTGRRYSGKQVVEMDSPLDTMPLFVKSGAIVQMIPEDVDTLVPRNQKTSADIKTLDDRRIIQVWPGSGGQRELSTLEGIVCSAACTVERGTITVFTREKRPLEIQIMFCDIGKIISSENPPDGYKYDRRQKLTSCRWNALKGKASISW